MTAESYNIVLEGGNTSLLATLLRIITPEEIQELTTISQGEERHCLTDMLRDSIGIPIKDETKILELKSKRKLDKEVPFVKQNFNSENKGVVFLLEIKDKMKKSRESLKSKEIFSLYHKSSMVDMDQERSHKDDLKKNSYLGVLINKKQT